VNEHSKSDSCLKLSLAGYLVSQLRKRFKYYSSSSSIISTLSSIVLRHMLCSSHGIYPYVIVQEIFCTKMTWTTQVGEAWSSLHSTTLDTHAVLRNCVWEKTQLASPRWQHVPIPSIEVYMCVCVCTRTSDQRLGLVEPAPKPRGKDHCFSHLNWLCNVPRVTTSGTARQGRGTGVTPCGQTLTPAAPKRSRWKRVRPCKMPRQQCTAGLARHCFLRRRRVRLARGRQGYRHRAREGKKSTC
jgi:hypothetical protein